MPTKCWCQKFDVPECCDRYLEDPQGTLVHTAAVCYRVSFGPVASYAVVDILPGPATDAAIIAQAFRDEFEAKPLDVSMSTKVEPA